MRVRAYLVGLPVIVIIAAQSAIAAPDGKSSQAPSPRLLQDVVACEAIADATQRLACYDAAVAEMEKAVKNRDLVVADRATMRETRKGIFGFDLPKLKLFSGNKSEDVRQIEDTVEAVRYSADGMPIFSLAGGGRWKLTSGPADVAQRGSQVTIKRGAFNSYFMIVKGGRSARVLRIN